MQNTNPLAINMTPSSAPAQNTPADAMPFDESLDLSTVDISRPLLNEGRYTLKVKKATYENDTLILQLATTEDEFRYGTTEKVPAGSITIFHRILSKPTGKLTEKMVVERLAQLVQAARMRGCGRNPAMWVNRLQDVTLEAQVRYVPETVEVDKASGMPTGRTFPEKNEIRYFIAPQH